MYRAALPAPVPRSSAQGRGERFLFGSRARGGAAPESDVDLLVVTDHPGSKRKQAVAIDLALADIRVAKDVIVVGVEELERDRDVVGTIAYPAFREGIVLYDRAA